MYSIPINIDTSQVTNSEHHDVTIQLETPIYLDPSRSYTVYLHHANLWNCWTNISARQNNNTMRIRDNFGDWFNITFPDGAYNIEDMNIFLFNFFQGNNMLTTDENGTKISPIYFTGNVATGQTIVNMQGGFQWDTSTGNLRLLLGFNSETIIATSQYFKKTGENLANISNDINSVMIHCSLIDGRFSIYNGKTSDIIFSSNINVPQGYQMQLEPKNVVPIPINSHNLSTIRMRVTDQLNRDLIMTEPVSYCLIIQRMD